ncbi:hypothetical protein Tcan_16490 [Toxocara canis]|uniref:Uncharacterized protein n=1 Tax=Toxocara canis TaxID=6265 RepID=A0A0B2W3G5_TOXCA|nr:hypothetical protein Tcan_16490 [Toxocara canis]
MAASQMFVDMKMSITTYGAHSGLIVHSGIHQGKSNLPLIWPYSNGTQPTSPPSIPFISTQEPVAVSQQQQQPQQSLPWRKEPSPQTSPVYSFHGTDSPPSEFIEPENVQLNVFHVDSPNYTESQSRKELKNEQAVGHHPDALLNDALTTTTTVEIFRTKVDPNNSGEYLTLPPVPAPGMDGRPQVLRAMGPDYEKWTNTRTETLSNEPVKWRDNVGSRSLFEAVPHDENYASTAIVNNAYRPAQLASTYQPAANRRLQHRNEPTSQQRAGSRRLQESPYYGDRGGQLEDDKEEKGENIYEVARSRSVEEIRKLDAPDYTRQCTHMRNDESFYEASAGNSPRRLEATRTGMAKREPRSATSEEIFHLYETRDAFGNIRAQWRKNFDDITGTTVHHCIYKITLRWISYRA